jgi:hypothetical protein
MGIKLYKIIPVYSGVSISLFVASIALNIRNLIGECAETKVYRLLA